MTGALPDHCQILWVRTEIASHKSPQRLITLLHVPGMLVPGTGPRPSLGKRVRPFPLTWVGYAQHPYPSCQSIQPFSGCRMVWWISTRSCRCPRCTLCMFPSLLW